MNFLSSSNLNLKRKMVNSLFLRQIVMLSALCIGLTADVVWAQNAFNITDTSDNSLFYIQPDGKIGVGTITPNELLTVEGILSLKESAAPSATTGYGKLYIKSDAKLYYKGDNGTEICLTDFIKGNGSVANADLADNAVSTAKIQDGAVTEVKIGTGAVTVSKLGELSVGAAHIQAGSVSNSHISEVDAAKITTGTLESGRIPNLDTSKITTGTFGSSTIADGAVTETKIGAGAVTVTKLGELSVGAAHIQNGSIRICPQIT